MEEHKDVRILTLQKQHYFEEYVGHMSCQYTCWGYYDGISIEEISSNKSKLFEKESDAPVSQLWYGSGESTNKLEGTYSRQNIGIFRCLSDEADRDNTASFWEKYKVSPYFAVGFAKLGNAALYKEVSGMLDKIYSYERDKQENDRKYVKTSTYYTFDNADIIILILSNSLKELGEFLEKIEGMSEIAYMYSVMSVNEAYLEECKKRKGIIGEWEGIPCYIDEKISGMTMSIATSGKKETLQKIKGKIKSDWEEYRAGENPNLQIQYSYTAGHQTYVLQFYNICIKDIILFYIPGGTATHSNELFGKEIYNIETDIRISEASMEKLPFIEGWEGNNENKKKLWCQNLIQKYVKRMNQAFEDKDESLYSYYKAVIQTVNTLAQYEGFPMSKDIFYLLFPAFDMFDRRLDIALKQAEEPENSHKMADIKKSICDFIDAVNSIIYHTIHTDQIFLMVPGYSGTSFSIPIKLCLAYLWLADKVIRLLNDKDYEYNCFITPEMESCPVTTLIDMGMPGKDRLICFCSSQRSLYMPRYFTIILTHEIAHYVGTDIRLRKERGAGLIVMLAYFLAEGVFPDEYLSSLREDSDAHRIVKEIYDNNKIKAQIKAADYLKNKIRNGTADNLYHATEISPLLEEGCLDFLSNSDDGIYPEIYKVPDAVVSMIEKENVYEKAKMVYDIQTDFDSYRKKLQTSKIMESIIEELILVYREVFSDVAAISILKCSENSFREAYDVSEGVKTSDGRKRSTQQRVRDHIAHCVFWELPEETLQREMQQDWLDGLTEKPAPGEEDEEWPKKLVTRMYSYRWVRDELLEYARDSKIRIENRLSKVKTEELEEIQKFYKLFSLDEEKKKNNGEEKTCGDIYDILMKRILNYIDMTDKKYRAILDAVNETE